ncbi:MAG TPA: hypothetical protein VK574_18960 [Terracidiphilus sp.]|nr:hypothetical protein [Terracidiphilus sp.]
MFVSSLRYASLLLVVSSLSLAAPADDLHFKKSISVEGNPVSGSETWVKGTRERTVTKSPAGDVVSLRQCDLKRTVTVNEQSQSYFVVNDPQDQSASNAAALMTGASATPSSSGGVITQTISVTDTGERKQISGYAARHLKTVVVVESSANACSPISQKYDIDGWYADLGKEQVSCSQSLPPVKVAANCTDRIVVRHKGTAKPGYPLRETIALQNDGANPTKIEVATSDISKETLKPELFDVPAEFHEVHSEMELYASAALQQPAQANSPAPAAPQNLAMNAMPSPSPMGMTGGMPSAMSMLAQRMGGKLPNGATGMQGPPPGAQVPLPQALGPKAPGKIRIGIAPAQAQMGQGNNAQADYSTPVRNAIVFMMNGPAVEITALDAQLPIQLQAEAQQKQCDYILVSAVTVKRASSGGLSKFMKAGSMAANFTPLGMMAHSMGAVNGMIATQTVMQTTAAMTTQQQAMGQLSGFNGQIKSKDEVTVDYQLLPTGGTQPKLQNELKGKSKSDGEDVLTPLIQQAANSILTEVTKK